MQQQLAVAVSHLSPLLIALAASSMSPLLNVSSMHVLMEANGAAWRLPPRLLRLATPRNTSLSTLPARFSGFLRQEVNSSCSG